MQPDRIDTALVRPVLSNSCALADRLCLSVMSAQPRQAAPPHATPHSLPQLSGAITEDALSIRRRQISLWGDVAAVPAMDGTGLFVLDLSDSPRSGCRVAAALAPARPSARGGPGHQGKPGAGGKTGQGGGEGGGRGGKSPSAWFMATDDAIAAAAFKEDSGEIALGASGCAVAWADWVK